MTDRKSKLIVITGPTASGKSSIAVDLALEFNGEVVNADSMQVYRYMDIGTAKIRQEDMMGIPHHIIDIVDPDKNFNASEYRSVAEPKVYEINSRNKNCFVVGGSGLYIKALLGGLFKCPPSDHAVRKTLFLEWENLGGKVLYERLRKVDPEAACKIHPNNRVRILRALEVAELAGRPFSILVKEHDFGDTPFDSLKICLDIERDQLYKRINNRSLAMIGDGLIDEVEMLLEKGFSSDLKSMNSLGYRHISGYLRGEYPLDMAISKFQQDTRKYAKRQLTWFRADPEMIWMNPGDRDGIRKKVREFLSGSKA